MDPYSLSVILIAISAGALVKGATGMGMPLIAMPFMASVLGMQHAIVVLVLPIIVSNIWQVWRYRGERSDERLAFLVPMLIACTIGVAMGTWLLTTLPERGLALTLGLLLLGYKVFRLLRPSFSIDPATANRFAVPAGLGAGVLHGATGISAPIGVTFIHAMRFSRDVHVFAISAMFLVLAAMQASSLWVAGVLRPAWMVGSVLALIPTFVVMPVGQWLGSKLSPAAFDRLILAFLGVIGLKLVFGL